MNKLRLVLTFILILTTLAVGQSKYGISFGGGYSVPSGEVQKNLELKNGWNATALVERSINNILSVYIRSGINQWMGKEKDLLTFQEGKAINFRAKFDQQIIPIMGGLKYFLGNNLYGIIELGLNLSDETISLKTTEGKSNDLTAEFESTLDGSTESKFGVGIGLGYKFVFFSRTSFDLVLKYSRPSEAFTYIDLNAMIGFSIF